MVRHSVAEGLVILLCLSACTGARQDPAPPSPPIEASGTAPAARCALPAPAGATSKLRHIPDEDDPCANSRGLSPR
jgi:hypothetical protein